MLSRVPPSSPSPTLITQGKCAPTPIAFLKHFGLGSPADKLLAADGVHHFANLLSLSSDMHSQFDELNLWFEATDEVYYK